MATAETKSYFAQVNELLETKFQIDDRVPDQYDTMETSKLLEFPYLPRFLKYLEATPSDDKDVEGFAMPCLYAASKKPYYRGLFRDSYATDEYENPEFTLRLQREDRRIRRRANYKRKQQVHKQKHAAARRKMNEYLDHLKHAGKIVQDYGPSGPRCRSGRPRSDSAPVSRVKDQDAGTSVQDSDSSGPRSRRRGRTRSNTAPSTVPTDPHPEASKPFEHPTLLPMANFDTERSIIVKGNEDELLEYLNNNSDSREDFLHQRHRHLDGWVADTIPNSINTVGDPNPEVAVYSVDAPRRRLVDEGELCILSLICIVVLFLGILYAVKRTLLRSSKAVQVKRHACRIIISKKETLPELQ